MKALLYEGFGSPEILRYEDVEKPVPGENEVLIKVCAASVNPLDWKLMRGGPLPLRLVLGMGKPKVRKPGVDVAGVLQAVGANVTEFKPGDEVFGTCTGAFAEYATSASVFGMKSALVAKPKNVSFEQAASAPVAGLTALQGLRDKGRIQAGHKVLINGAAGGVGTFAVQIAKLLGAEVTGVCSTRNLDLVRSIGADHVIDYTRNDFTTSGERYDMLFDCIGNRSLASCRRILKPKGRLVLVGVPDDQGAIRIMARFTAIPLFSTLGSRKMLFFMARMSKDDLNALGEYMACGKVRPVIDRRYPLSEAAEAFGYLQQGHARRKVLITFQ